MSTNNAEKIQLPTRRKHQSPKNKWNPALVTYRCPHCVREQLVPVKKIFWYEYPLMLLLLKPWRCPHCFNRFIRGIL